MIIVSRLESFDISNGGIVYTDPLQKDSKILPTTGLQWLAFLQEELKAISSQQAWAAQMIKYIVSMRTQEVESKPSIEKPPSIFVSETTHALFGERAKSSNALEVSLEIDEEKVSDVRMRTFKYLSDYFWQNVQTQKRNESTSAKMRHESMRLSQVVSEGKEMVFRGSETNTAANPQFESRLNDDFKQKLLFSQTLTSPPINHTQSGTSSSKERDQQFIFQDVDDAIAAKQEPEVKVDRSSKYQEARSNRLMSVREILTDENGVDALQASDETFNNRIILIKKQLEQKDHPINELITQFDKIFYSIYSKDIEKGMKSSNAAPSEALMKKIIAEVQTWVRLVFFTILRFYRLNLQGLQFGDVRKDLLLNMITSLIMMDHSYSIIMNSILQAQSERVKQIQRNMSKYKYKLSLDKLGVSKYFQLSPSFREAIAMGKGDPKKTGQVDFESIIEGKAGGQSNVKPFERTINALKEIPDVNSPMAIVISQQKCQENL